MNHKYNNWKIIIFCLLCLAFSSPLLAAPLTLSDDLGRSLSLSAPAQRVVVLGDFCAELVCALKAGDLLVGRARWVNWPPQVAALPHLGLQAQPNLEVLLKWRPDLVLADAHLRQALPLLEKLDIPVLIYQGRDWAAIKRAAQNLALALDRTAQGDKLLGFIDEIEQLLRSRLAGVPSKPLFLAFSQYGPPYYDILSVRPLLAEAGLYSLAPPWGSVNPEWLLRHPPELAVLVLWRPGSGQRGPESLEQAWRRMRVRPELAALPALYLMDSRLAYNLRALAGVLYLAKWRHPEVMEGVEPGRYQERLEREFLNQPFSGPLIYAND